MEKESTIHNKAKVGLESPESVRRLRIACRIIVLALGAADAWASRFTMNPDGVSYLDIGDAYWRGDWHNAINAYWSPLYSWILGFFLKVLKPSIYWEYPVVHLANFLVYVASLICFEFFLATFIKRQHDIDVELSNRGETAIPTWGWWVIGYSVFISSSIFLITLAMVTPDMCVAGIVFVASGLLLKLQNGTATNATFVSLGLMLGTGYLAKSVMLPLGFVFVLSVLASRKCDAYARRAAFTSGIVFILTCTPFVTAISIQKQRPTFGDSGRITYEILVNQVQIFTPEGKSLAHPARIIFEEPTAHEFREPIGGTYPLWYDPSYWHEGLKPHFDLKRELAIVEFALLTHVYILGSTFLPQLITVFLLCFIASKPGSCVGLALRNWPLLVPAAIALFGYACVYTENRYVGPFLAVTWLVAYSGVHLPSSRGMKKFTAAAVSGVLVMTVAFGVWRSLREARSRLPAYVIAAQSFHSNGSNFTVKLAVISETPYEKGGAFVARLARLKIIAQSSDTQRFGSAVPATRAHLLEAFAKAGADFVITDSTTGSPDPCWHQVGMTQYSICELQSIMPSESR